MVFIYILAFLISIRSATLPVMHFSHLCLKSFQRCISEDRNLWFILLYFYFLAGFMYNWSIYFVYLHDCKQIGVSGEDLFIHPKKLTRTSRLSIRCFVNISLHMRGLNKITKFLENPLIKKNIIKRKEGN